MPDTAYCTGYTKYPDPETEEVEEREWFEDPVLAVRWVDWESEREEEEDCIGVPV